jgi:hypothetical protein
VDERELLVTASLEMAQSWGSSWGGDFPEGGLVKPPRHGSWALSPAGMFEEKAPLRLAAQKSRPHAPLAPMRNTPAYFLCNWGYYLD